MKKIWLAAFAMCIGLFGCQMVEIYDGSNEGISEAMVFYATIEEEGLTRTTLDEHNNIRWSENDQIVIFKNTTLGARYQVKDSAVGKTTGVFSQVPSGDSGDDFNSGNALEHNIAYYPYSESVECDMYDSDYKLYIALPSEQMYAAESFGNATFPMVAVSETNNITFRNICGGMKLHFKGTCEVTSIKVEGKNNERLSGKATVIAYTENANPAIAMVENASTSVVLNCGDGVQLNESVATAFIISLPPTTFANGFEITVTDSHGGVQVIETSKANSVFRSSLLMMPEVTLQTIKPEPEYKEGDYVDEYDVNHGQGVMIKGVVWAPVNCGYKAPTSDGKGFPYGKLYQWGRKYGQGQSEDYDESVPQIKTGPIRSLDVAQSIENENVFYTGRNEVYNDWLYEGESGIWNGGSDSNPKKTQYDPCPDNWRLPTESELNSLFSVSRVWKEEYDGLCGFLFQSMDDQSEMFLPAAGYRSVGGDQSARGKYGRYWSSYPSNSFYSTYFFLSSSTFTSYSNQYRAIGCSVRCVQESDL